MRVFGVVLLAVLTLATAGCSGSPDVSSTSASSTTSSSEPRAASTTTSLQITESGGLAGVLPATIGGQPTTRTNLAPTGRSAPKVFLKMIGRLGKETSDARLAVAYVGKARIYALQVAGVSGSDIEKAFLEERSGVRTEAGVRMGSGAGSKNVTRLDRQPGTYIYAGSDIFFYVESPDQAAGADIAKQLP